ncbi:hypothetical protein MBLNU230_g5913t1 [Neophaeotheca triangularis]
MPSDPDNNPAICSPSPFSPKRTPSTFSSRNSKFYTFESPSASDLGFDEDSIKETPPRPSYGRQESLEPRPLGEVIDEAERSGSPTLRRARVRPETSPSPRRSPSPITMAKGSGAKQGNQESYADVAKEVLPAEGTGPNAIPEGARPTDGAQGQSESYANAAKEVLPAEGTGPNAIPKGARPASLNVDGEGDDDGHLSGVGEDASPRSPTREKAQRRVSSKSKANGSAGESKQGAQATQGAMENERPQQTNGDGAHEKRENDEQPKEVFYENYKNKSGENLASVKPLAGYEESVQQRENKPTEPTGLGESKEQHKSHVQRPQHSREPSHLTSGRRAGANWSRIRWAPMNVPLQRRLQTGMVLAHTLSIAGFLALFFVLCAIPLLWPLLVPYLVYTLLSNASTSGTLSHRSERLRRLPIFSLFASYFPARLHRTQELEPTRKYIFGYHPHGIISHGAFAAFATESLGFSTLFPGITNTLLTLDTNFRIPLYRDYALRMGLASVSRESCENLLSKGGRNGEGMGRAITIVVGGARESLDAEPFKLRCVLKKRKGFVKLAIRQGADLVPVLAFGENDLYDQFDATRNPWIHRGQMAVKKLIGFTVPLFHARGIFNYDVGLMPYRRPLDIVVGKPIRVQQQKNPDSAYVDQLHEAYTEELLRIWDEWKDTFARGRKGELEIVE